MFMPRRKGLKPSVFVLWTIMVVLGHSTALIASSYHHYASRVIASRRRHILTTPSPKQMMSAVRCPHKHRSRLFSFTSDRYEEEERIIALHAELQKLNIDAAALNDANLQAVENPTNGYDGQYGKSAIKTYRSFVQAKSSDDDTVKNISVLAGRVARQIDFLIKRHKSHESEWIRHSDTAKETRQTFPLILLLDNLRGAFNVGSLFRTADAAGCSRVVTTGITPHPGGSGAEKLTKSALGADRMVPSCHFDNTLQAIESLKEKLPDYKLIGMETTERSAVYSDYKYPKEGMVLILGNEVTGVDTEIIPLIDALVEIPMFGAKNSLNVAACAPVVLFEALRQWKVLDSIESSE